MTNLYYVNDIYPSIQGEGVMTGVPMVIVRLHGCGVGCKFCDTKETWVSRPANQKGSVQEALGQNKYWALASGKEIAAFARELAPRVEWALVTGGEPADQDLVYLAAELREAGFKVALETSGTATGHLKAKFDWVCVSPKIDNPAQLPILGSVIKAANEIKAVIVRAEDLDALDDLLVRTPRRDGQVICLQPVSQSEGATELCVKTAMERGWRLSIQTHKYIQVR